jgi:glycosyltransferase involved in cell wall biosynthesis
LRQLRGFDLIHWHYPFFGGEITALAARLYRIPLVITYHQDVFLSGPLALIENILRPTLSRMSLRSARRVLFTSLDYAQASYSRPLLKGREGRIGELPNGVDIARFSPADAPAELRQELKLVADDKVALLVAGLDRAHYFKGVEVFLTALVGLESNIKGVIVGDGDLRAGYQQLAQELGLGERVNFVGRVAEAALPDYYRLAGVTVLPSLTMGEAFGLVLVESLASGTPIIASNLPGVRMVVDAPNTGLLVEPGDAAALAQAIRQILTTVPLRRELAQRGRARVEQNYDWQQIGLRLESIYREVLTEFISPSLLGKGAGG